MPNITGSCLCGAVRYESEAEPMMVAACHCTTCQKNTGSAFSLNVAMPVDAVSIHGDSLKTYAEKVNGSDEPFYRSFCVECGSPISGQGAAYPGILFVKAGTLDDPSWVKPDMHIWCSEKQPWLQIADAAKQCLAGPE